MLHKKRTKRHIYGVLLVIMACVIVEIVARIGWLESIEHVYYDLWHQMAGQRAEPQNTAIVTVDNQTLLEHKDEPLAFWGPHFARAIDVLRKVGVKVIGIDFLFSVSAESWLSRLEMMESDLSRTYDIPMRQQLNAGRVVLIGILANNERGENEILLPVPDLLFSLPGGLSDVGLANLYLDDDEVVRRFMPALLEEGALPRHTLAALMAGRASGSKLALPEHQTENGTLNAAPRAIGYLGPPGTIPRISFRRLLAPQATSDPSVKGLRDKVVIISAEHAGNFDTHLTPYAQRFISRKNAMMTGAEIHANIVETLLTGRFPCEVPAWFRIVFLTAVLTIGTILFLRLGPVNGLGCVFLLGLFSLGVSYLFFLGGRILPAGNVHAALGLSYIGAIGFRLTSEEKTRSRLQEALSPYVSDAVVEKVLASSKLPDLGGEILHVAVLFSDIRGFTSISEKLNPHEVVEMLNNYFSRACEPIMEQEGMVDKFIGDAIMAIFGAPVSFPDQTRRCLLAALAMVEIAEDFQKWLHRRFPDRNLPAFQIGIGIHIGEAVIGNIGSAKRMGYTAIGDAVNIASRLEGLCKKLGWTIVASRKAVTEAGPDVVTGGSKMETPSGRTGQIEVVEVLGIGTTLIEPNS